MREKLQLIMKHLRQESLQKVWKQTIWIYQYGRRYWKSMILYTLHLTDYFGRKTDGYRGNAAGRLQPGSCSKTL